MYRVSCIAIPPSHRPPLDESFCPFKLVDNYQVENISTKLQVHNLMKRCFFVPFQNGGFLKKNLAGFAAFFMTLGCRNF